MRKIVLSLFVAVVAGCGPGNYAAPSGHYQDGLPEGAEVIVSTGHDRYYKYKDCLIRQYWSGGQWVTSTVECN